MHGLKFQRRPVQWDVLGAFHTAYEKALCAVIVVAMVFRTIDWLR